MKYKILTLLLIISSYSYSQKRVTVKVQGDGNTFDSTQVNEKLAEKLDISDSSDYVTPTHLATAFGKYNIINVNDYGAVGDGVTDNKASLQAAFDAAINGSTIYFPDSAYYTSGGLVIDKNVSLKSSGGNYTLNLSDTLFGNTGTRIIIDSDTDSLLKITAPGCNIEGIALVNKHSTEPSAGYGLYLSNAGSFTMIRCVIKGFYDNFRLEQGTSWNIIACNFINPTHYNLKISNPTTPDQGDYSISGCNFLTNNNISTDIRFESSGGFKINNTKFQPLAGNLTRFFTGIDVQAKYPGTSILLVTNCSFEGYSGFAIRVQKDTLAAFNSIKIDGNQFYPVNTTNPTTAIYIKGRSENLISGVLVKNNIVIISKNDSAAIKLENVYAGDISGNVVFGGTNKYKLTNTSLVLSDNPSDINVMGNAKIGEDLTLPTPTPKLSVVSNSVAATVVGYFVNKSNSGGTAILRIQNSTNDTRSIDFEFNSSSLPDGRRYGTYADANIVNNTPFNGAYANINIVTQGTTAGTGAVRAIFGGGTQAGKNGIGLTAPTEAWDVNGNIKASGTVKGSSFITSYVSKTANYTLTTTDDIVEVTANTVTQTLPTAVGITGRSYTITNSGTGTVTIATTSSQTFINVTGTPTTLSVPQFTNYRLVSNGANWLAYKIVN